MAKKKKTFQFQVMFESGYTSRVISTDFDDAINQALTFVKGSPKGKEKIVQITKIEKHTFPVTKSGKKYKVVE